MTTIAQGIIEFGGDASGVTAAAAEVGKSLDSIGSKVKTLGSESGDGFKKVEDGAKGAAKATQTWNEYLKENIAEARKQFASQDLNKAEAYSASVKKVAESWKEMQKARLAASTPIPLGVDDVDALTKAQDRLLNSIARQATVVTEGKAKWLELRAAQAGISEQATPYIAKLKSIEKTTNDLGISQGQLTAAMRGVPAQFTDIITSLQGGQKPLTVFLQQGGQLKDMFGGAGNAARALGGYVLGLVNPFTIAAGAVGVLAVAYNQGSSEAQQFANALITTGNAAGTTKNQLMDMARTISESGMSTQGAAAEALTALVGTGKVGVDNLQKFASVAVQAQKVIGASIQDTAKDFAELGKSPLQASIKLDEQYNFLTVSIYKQIKALQDQGKTTEAATLAQNTYADSLASRTAGIEQNLGSIERGWLGVKNFAKSAWDEMLGVGRDTTESERINQLQTNIKNRLDFIARERPQSLLIPKAQNDNATDQRELDLLLKKTEQQKIQADLKAKENAAKNAGLEFDRQGDEFLTKKAKLTNEIAKATNIYLKSIESDPRSNAEKEKDLVLTERLGKIREKYKETITKEENAYQSLSRTISEKVALSQVELNSEKPLTDAQKLRVKLMELVSDSHGKITKAQEIEQKKKIDLIRSNELARSSYEALRKELEKFKPSVTADDLVANIVKQDKAYSDITETQRAYRQSLQDNAELMQLENSLAGQSATDRNTAIEQYKIQIALERELLKIKEDINLSDARKNELSDVARENANIAKSQAALKVQKDEWSKFYGDIYNGLTDSLYRGFEAGKGFFKSFWDGIKNLFKTTVLKLAVQGVMTGVLGFGAAGQAGAAQANPFGDVSSLLSVGKTIFQGFSASGVALNTSLATSIGELGATFGNEFMLSVSSMMQGGAASGAAGTVAGGLTSAATAMPYVAAAVAAFQGMKAINGGYRLGGLSSDAGAAIFGIAPRLFGRKAPELQQSELSGSVGAGGFNATTRDVYMAKGGVFRSDKWSEVKTPLADSSGLTKQYEAIKAVAASYANLLGLSTESLASFSKSFTFNLSKTGDAAKDAEANQKLINDLFVGITNDITNLLAPSISAFSKEGESTSQTLQRLATSLTDVNAVVKSVGFSGFAKSLDGASAAQKLADVTGGIEKLASGTQFFFENFLNDAEKIKPSIDQVAATMARLGQSSVDTIPEFKSLVQGLDLTTESGAKMYAELIAIAPQFKAVADYMGQATVAIEDNAAALKRAQEVADERKSLQDELNSYQQQYNELTLTSAELLKMQKDALDASNTAMFDDIQALKLKVNAKLQADAAEIESAKAVAKEAEKIATQREGLQSRYNALQDEYNSITLKSAELLQLQKSAINSSNIDLFDSIQLIQEKIVAEKTLAAEKKAIEDQGIALQEELNNLKMTEADRSAKQAAGIAQVNRDIYDQIIALKAKNKTDEDSIKLAEKVRDQKQTLQDELDRLTMNEEQLYKKRKATYYEGNQDLFDQIEQIKKLQASELKAKDEYLAKIAEQKRIADAIDAERAGLQDEYNQLTMTEIQLMELKKATLNESNRDLFDLIQAEKLRRAEQSKIEESAKAAQSEYAQAMQSAADSLKTYLNDIVSEFGSLAKSLRDFSRGLTVGETSKISPEDRYKLLGAEVNALLPKVQSGDKKALGEWTKISQEYLESSQDYNATNLQYFKDLEFIKQHTDAAAIYAQSQVDVAQLQLDLMGDQLGALRTLNSSVLDVVSAINGANSSSSSNSAGSVSAASSMSLVQGYKGNVLQNLEGYGGLESLYSGATTGNTDAYKTLKKQMERWSMMGLDKNALDQILGAGWYEKLKAIPGFKNGGLANGLAMVGEDGAELVNFKSPARVYNSNDTKSILGGNSESSKETNDLLKKQNALMERLISKLEGTAGNTRKGLDNVAQKIGVVNAAAKFEKAAT
jgi:phage-related minor tail protein